MSLLRWFGDSSRNNSSSSAPKHVYILSLLLLICCAQDMHSVEDETFVITGRPFAKQLLEITEEGGEIVGVTMIGSRPPRCSGKCLNCGRCEAVQVPAAPRDKSGPGRLSATTNSMGDDGSNYKPLSRKCKCGGVILNP